MSNNLGKMPYMRETRKKGGKRKYQESRRERILVHSISGNPCEQMLVVEYTDG